MARKSRKKFGRITEERIERKKKYQVGIYARLSVKGNERKEESIDTQIAICREYIKNNPDMIWIDSYTDIGKSGMNFQRNGFTKMIEEAKEGKINCIMAKDLSRIGRNHVETGFYIEKFLTQYHIRVIAVNDSFDSFRWEEKEEIFSLKNLVNEMYARDISRKVVSAKQQQWEKGEYVGGIPPYGYQVTTTSEGRKLEIEEETAEIVREIYKWYSNKKEIKEIVEILHQRNINPPREYRRTGKVRVTKETDVKYWSVTMIKQMLNNPIYLGYMVKGKIQKKRNTHPPIICKKIQQEELHKII